MKTNVERIAVGYCRVSTDKQREESIDHQKREIQKYADENNIKIINWYVDHGYSGTTDKRPDFQRMLRDSAKRNFNLVLVWKLDRFSRDIYSGAIAKHILRDNGVELFSVIERIDNTPQGKLIEGMLEQMNQFYVANLAQNVLGGMKENAYHGYSIGSCTYGYRLTPKLDENGNVVNRTCHGGKTKPINVYTLHPKNSEAVKLIFEMFLAGANREMILTRLKTLGYKNAKGKDFQPTHIDKILRNERYTGVYIMVCNQGKQVNYMSREIIRTEGGLPKIIEKEDFDKVQQMLDARKHRPNSNSAVDYLLTGKMFCGECGGAFTGSTHFKKGQPYFYYRCGRNHPDCKMVSIRKEAIEDFVIEEIKKIVRSEEYTLSIIDRFVEFYKKKNDNSEIIKNLRTNLKSVERKIENLTNIIAETGKFSDTFEAQLNSYTDEKAKILADLNRESNIEFTQFVSKDSVRRSYCKVIKLLQSGETEDKHTIIDTVLNRVIVYKDRVETFINILPYEGATAEMSITNDDLSAYGLLEAAENKKTAQIGDFPSDIVVGSPEGNRTPDTAVKGRCLNRLTTGPNIVV